MLLSPRDEWTRLRRAVARLDTQTAFVLTFAAFAVVLQYVLGSRQLFYDEVAPFFSPEWRALASWGWWFGMKGVLGFLLPVLALRTLFAASAEEMGLGLGNWRLATLVAAVYLPIVLAATWVLSDSTAFQEQYPHLGQAKTDWTIFLIYEALFLFYWMGWEYLWRGFVIFGTAHTLGLYSIFVQAIPFAALHVDKPWPEALLSVVGGIALGALVWRCRSFWIAVPIHAAQMLMLDFWCTLRARTAVDGIGFGALVDVFGTL